MSIQLPPVLAFERKLETSDALMYAGNWGETDEPKAQDWKIVPIIKRQNRSTQSAYGIADEKKSEPNPVSSNSDDANLPHGKDTLKLSFSIRIIGNLGKPFACSLPDFEKALNGKISAYKEEEIGLKKLALRYAYNIVNGRFLWRNRVGAEKITIRVKASSVPVDMTFNAYEFSMKNFTKNADNPNLAKLAEVICAGLSGDDKSFASIDVTAFVKLGNGQHVFPSQEMNMGEKKKVLFKLSVDGQECAAMHNVKIGNAVRTIDDWYTDAEFPIAVEPYGSVTQMGQAFRKSRNDLYSLMIKWLDEKAVTDDDKNFVVANLIRGGVFGGKSDK